MQENKTEYKVRVVYDGVQSAKDAFLELLFNLAQNENMNDRMADDENWLITKS